MRGVGAEADDEAGKVQVYSTRILRFIKTNYTEKRTSNPLPSILGL